MGFWLIFLLGVSAWVVWRQTSSVLIASELRELRSASAALEARRAELVGRAREASGRAVLVPRAESLGLRIPADSELVFLRAPLSESSE